MKKVRSLQVQLLDFQTFAGFFVNGEEITEGKVRKTKMKQKNVQLMKH